MHPPQPDLTGSADLLFDLCTGVARSAMNSAQLRGELTREWGHFTPTPITLETRNSQPSASGGRRSARSRGIAVCCGIEPLSLRWRSVYVGAYLHDADRQ
jgi:hypothetical protein